MMSFWGAVVPNLGGGGKPSAPGEKRGVEQKLSESD